MDPVPGAPRDCVLFATERYAWPILAPLAGALREAGYRPHTLATGNAREGGLAGVPRADVRKAVALRPWAVFSAANDAPTFLSGAKVQLFHGFNVEKRSDARGHFRIRGLFDLYCTQGPATTVPFRELAAREGHFAVVETGWPKLDPLFSCALPLADALRAPAGDRPVVLFASTFTERLSAAPRLLDAIAAEIAGGQRYWLLTLHPKCPPELFERYRALACANAAFVEPEDIVTAQRAADVLLSDTTSVVPEFVVQHKPVVTFRHRMPETYMLDFTEVDRLPEMLDRAFAPTAELREAIVSYANWIHPYRDGRSSERVLDAIDAFIARGGRNRRAKPWNLWRKLKIRRRIGYWGPARLRS